MFAYHRPPCDVHFTDCFQKTQALRNTRRTWSSRVWRALLGATFSLLLFIIGPQTAHASQRYEFDITVSSGAATRVDMPVDAPIDLTTFVSGLGAALDPAALQVVELDSLGNSLNDCVLFQFDAADDFDPATNAAGTLVFVMNDSTPPLSTRHYRVLFDVVGACDDCPAPPPVPVPTTVDSLMYEGQMTYQVTTPRADYFYHQEGAGLASIIDADGQDWIGFHDIAGSRETGEFRGIPNLVFVSGNSAASFFHPGFHNATSSLVSAGPLKVSVRSITNDADNEWIVRWDFYQNFARLTVEQTGTSNGGDYWFLYEGTPGGSLDTGDVVVRSDGTSTGVSATTWQTTLPDPQWVYFHDTAASRYLYVSDDSGDQELDSCRSMGQAGGSNPGMTVFGLGRVLSGSLVPHLTGSDRTFTIGLGENDSTATGEISGAYLPLQITIGDAAGSLSSVGSNIPRGPVLRPNYPNPFNPATTISLSLAAPGPVRLGVYDLVGRLVRQLADEHRSVGTHTFVWNGHDDRGRMVASGIYLYRLEAGGQVLRGKMTLVE